MSVPLAAPKLYFRQHVIIKGAEVSAFLAVNPKAICVAVHLNGDRMYYYGGLDDGAPYTDEEKENIFTSKGYTLLEPDPVRLLR